MKRITTFTAAFAALLVPSVWITKPQLLEAGAVGALSWFGLASVSHAQLAQQDGFITTPVSTTNLRTQTMEVTGGAMLPKPPAANTLLKADANGNVGYAQGDTVQDDGSLTVTNMNVNGIVVAAVIKEPVQMTAGAPPFSCTTATAGARFTNFQGHVCTCIGGQFITPKVGGLLNSLLISTTCPL